MGPGIKTGLKIKTNNPKETGTDRIVDAVAAYTLYGGPVIVIDFGTATTYDVVSENGEFLGGVITPGLSTSVKVLTQQAAKLPEIEIRKTDTIIGKTILKKRRPYQSVQLQRSLFQYFIQTGNCIIIIAVSRPLSPRRI